LDQKGIPLKVDFHSFSSCSIDVTEKFFNSFIENNKLGIKGYDLKKGSKYYMMKIRNRKYYYILDNDKENNNFIVYIRCYNEYGDLVLSLKDIY
jgi:hypothetical protein